jgi:hypothetical protein
LRKISPFLKKISNTQWLVFIWIAGIVLLCVLPSALHFLPRAIQVAGLPITLGKTTGTMGLVVAWSFFMAVYGGYYDGWRWTGFSGLPYKKKTLWDWMQLLLIPVILAAGGLFFNYIQTVNEQIQVEQRAKSDRESSELRAQTDRDLAKDSQREVLLQSYLDQMTVLLLERGLGKSNIRDSVRDVARIRTLSVLNALDGNRKRSVMLFLQESGLITTTTRIGLDEHQSPRTVSQGLISLSRADLRDADLRGLYLVGVNIAGADLTGADLTGADLRAAELTYADLKNANFTFANLTGAHLIYADIRGADFRGANLEHSNLIGAYYTGGQLDEARLKGATMPWATKHP